METAEVKMKLMYVENVMVQELDMMMDSVTVKVLNSMFAEFVVEKVFQMEIVIAMDINMIVKEYVEDQKV